MDINNKLYYQIEKGKKVKLYWNHTIVQSEKQHVAQPDKKHNFKISPVCPWWSGHKSLTTHAVYRGHLNLPEHPELYRDLLLNC